VLCSPDSSRFCHFFKPKFGVRRFLTVLSDRYNRILGLGLPIIGGMISQNVLNLIDTAMVGRLGDVALAAVGTASFINFMIIAFVTGLSASVQALVARRKGEGRDSEMAIPLNGGLLISLILAIPWTIGFYLAAPAIFRLVNDTPAVAESGAEYLQVRLLAMVAVGMNFSFRGFWNGIDMPHLYLRTLVMMHSVNVFLNYVLIFGNLGFPELGTYGAGLGTSISLCLGTVYYFYLGFKHAKGHHFLHGIPSMESMKTMLRLTIPNGLQQTFFAAGFTMLFYILGLVGTQTTAAANVLINIMLVAILPGLALGFASTTLVGQALGRGDGDDAKRWGWDVVRVGVVLLGLLGMPMWLFPEWILGIFMENPETIEIATVPLILVGVFIAVDGVGLVLQNALLGAGAMRQVMIVSVALQWFVFLPCAYLIGPYLGYGLMGIWLLQMVYRAIQALIFAYLWQRGDWIAIKI
jgi:putative MATE family efflux protein